jgi:hypothetical protein
VKVLAVAYLWELVRSESFANETKDVLDDTFASLLVQQAQILDPLSSSPSAKEITGHPGASLVR